MQMVRTKIYLAAIMAVVALEPYRRDCFTVSGLGLNRVWGTAEARKLEQQYPHALEVRDSQH